MYSMVLMAALATGVDMPDFGRRGGGCCGCYGGYGGWGGCYGGWGGCYGGGYAWGGWGGGYGGWGGGYGGWGGWGGGYAGWGGLGGTVYAAPVATYATPVLAANTPIRGNNTTSMYYNPDPNAGRRATIIVHLPADARLMVDGKATRATTATRRFVTPPLETGKGYHYTFKASIDREGEPQTISREVQVRAGQTEEVTLRFANESDSARRQRSPARNTDRNGSPDHKVRADQP